MFRSKEDNVVRISKSACVTNFSDNFGTRDLWNIRQTYGKDIEYSDDEESIRGVNDKPAESPLDEDVLAGECDVEGVFDTIFGDDSPSPISNNECINKEQEAAQQNSDDPFGFYELLKKPPNTIVLESDKSLSHPWGLRQTCHNRRNKMMMCVHSRKSLNGGSILDVLDDIIKVGQSMGYHMESDSVGNSGGILCVWEQSMFKKDGVSVSDNFIAFLIRFKKKLQDLKKVIRVWIRDMNILKEGVKSSLTNKLVDIDKQLDNGIISDDMLLNRLELSRKLYKLNQSDLKDAAQKAKVKWVIEGDENSKFFHGIINKRRAQLAIRGVIDNGVWLTDPPLDCGENKSPGPDGFTFDFFSHFWDLIGLDLCAAVNCFFDSGYFPRGYLISNTQSTFVKNRQILDGPFILNEALAWCKRKKKQALMFKEDFAKAYDFVRWDFLLNALHAFGFGFRWCSWIRGIFSSNMASILVNGSPTSEFLISYGLKQGDPLAPLLFILVMETLHISVSRSVHDGVFKGLLIHDSMLASGLKINMQKSQVLGVGVPSDVVIYRASTIGCNVMNLPFKYLGVTVGDHMSRHLAWSTIIQKIRSRLSMWKAKTLSIGGRLTLLKSVLGAVPLYTMSIYKAPKGVLHEMEMICNKFFIGTDSTVKKINWVTCDKVLASKKHGGLGVSSYYAFNRALLLKWVWDGVESHQWFELNLLLGSFIFSSSSDRWSCDLNEEDGPFVPMSNMSTHEHPLSKRQNQWSNTELCLANQDKGLKSIIIFGLPNDVMKSVIKYKSTKEMGNELVLAYEGLSDTKDTKIASLRLKFNAFKEFKGEKVNGTYTWIKCLLNELENNKSASESEVISGVGSDVILGLGLDGDSSAILKITTFEELFSFLLPFPLKALTILPGTRVTLLQARKGKLARLCKLIGNVLWAKSQVIRARPMLLSLATKYLIGSFGHGGGDFQEDGATSNTNIKQCLRKVTDRHFMAAVKVLSSTGVAPYCGAETVLHGVNKVLSEYHNDGYLAMLTMDLSNAFNLVDRSALLHEIKDSCKLLLYAWYLGDGTIIGDSEEVARLLDIIKRSSSGVKLLGGAISRDAYFISGLAMIRDVNAVDLLSLLPQLHDP
nr:RNA-directed DNA polymerase, eukaryota, reverse transcriptase zinc-binding domain protein [Tanacetum cinerariifolium]